MRIGLFGYGKMGKMIVGMAGERGHSVISKIDVGTADVDFSKWDVGIDFSTPNAALHNITNCLKNGVPIISGTTGWLKDYQKAIDICQENQGAFIHATNFSLGVNVFFELNCNLARMMARLEQYNISIEEIHHTQKLDAPSGTAISLAEGILKNSWYRDWKLDEPGESTIPIYSKREGMVPGTHIVRYNSCVDSIEIKHTAHNREGFALGAILAAEWIQGKKGVFTMRDVLNLK